jgi:protein SCO1/2
MKKYALLIAAMLLMSAGLAATTQNATSHDMDHDMAGMDMPEHAVANAAGVGAKGYSLVNQDGKATTDKDFKGKYQLIYFGFTSCPDVCPLDLRKMVDALKLTGDKEARIAPIFITIDPERDTPAVVKSYIAQFSPKLTGLTGTKAQVMAAEGSYKVYAAKAKSDSVSDYTMNHSAYMYLMGPDGNFIDVFDPQDKPADIAAKLKKSVN